MKSTKVQTLGHSIYMIIYAIAHIMWNVGISILG